MSALFGKLSQSWTKLVKDYRTSSMLKNYGKENLAKVKRILAQEKNYKMIDVEGYPSIFFFIEENDKEMTKFLAEQPYFSTNYLNSNVNPTGLTPITFSLLRSKNSIFSILEE
jgi:ankyrin repeat protein